MRYSYNNLWKQLIDKNLLKKDLMIMAELSPSTIAKLGKNKPVSLEVIGRICKVLNCQICDVVEIIF